MQMFEAHPVMRMHGVMTVPGDKSISHRALMLSGIAEGVSEVGGFLAGEDCLATLSAMRALGVHIEQAGATDASLANSRALDAQITRMEELKALSGKGVALAGGNTSKLKGQIEDVKALLEPRAKKLAGAIAGRALYDGRLDPAAALALIRNARAT